MKILFISHLSSRSGAPLLMLRLAAETAKRPGVEVSFLLGKSGALKKSFEAIGKIYFWDAGTPGLLTRARRKLRRMAGGQTLSGDDRQLKKIQAHAKEVDVVVVNTSWSLPMLEKMNIQTKRIVSYIHELEVMTAIGVLPATMKWAAQISDLVLVPCSAVTQFLVTNYGFAQEKIKRLNYIMPDVESIRPAKGSKESGEFFTIGACGTLDWRKGYDLFVLIAREIVHACEIRDVRFLWIGADVHSTEYLVFKQDIIKCGLEDFVALQPSSNQPAKWFSQFDLFILPSREDPYPLVVQELAQWEIPSICFNQAGGIPEFVRDDAGVVVDYLDIRGFCDAVLELKNNPELRGKLGKTAADRVRTENNTETIVQQFLNYCSSH